MLALARHEILAVRRTVDYLQKLADTLVPSWQLGDLNVTIDVLRQVLAEAEEHE